VTFGSLFAGIGGMDLGLERAGMRCMWQVEIDDYARGILARHWPDVRRWDDVRTFPTDVANAERFSGEPRRDARDMGREARTGQEDGTQRQRDGKSTDDRGSTWHVDLVAGGFPCQDVSYAGKGAGLAGERSGLWYEFARIVRVLRPRYVLVENVAALLTRGLDAVLGTLASLGYDAEWHCLPAAAVGAPHIRDRVFVVAYAVISKSGERSNLDMQRRRPRQAEQAGVGRGEISQPIGHRSQGLIASGSEARATLRSYRADCQQWHHDPADDPQSGVGGMVARLSSWMDGGLIEGKDSGSGAAQTLRNVWNDDVAQAVQRSLGGLSDFQAASVLFAFMREHKADGWLPRELLACSETLEGELRGMRIRLYAGSTPQGRGSEQQHAGEHPDAVRKVPRSHSSWDSCVPRVASGVPNRVDRLRGLGNAVVPQVAEWIGRRIMEHAEAAE
jgi:DNA (cytosine-5)-methyltransferase 1